MSPTQGWKNFDNSPSIKLKRVLPLARILLSIGIITTDQLRFVIFCCDSNIEWANAAKRIPVPTGSADVVYASHMLEHLTWGEVESFLAESKRVLCAGGTIRLAVPNIRFHIENYLSHEDADVFVRGTGLGRLEENGILKSAYKLMVGDRGHKWMYDGPSLCRLLERQGFVDAVILGAGETTLPEPGELNLRERVPESVFVEAKKL
ncbi:class I SAM-dependent methyltransferase [Thiocystis violacea]|uniref:class I SAM-dependent methyltransferase n=1 Tax=Thiocystis violacea TaxID=13725 RepID=UPI00190682D2|nr:methyltransferase domain-containing protein [Thiocystis violacea]